MLLTLNDYKDILKFYKVSNINNLTNKNIKNLAEDIIAEKLCRCIKKVSNNRKKLNESEVISICKNSVVKKKNLKISRFTCKNKSKLIPNKKTKKNLQKI